MDLRVLFRPHRWKYVRKMDHPFGCVFCAAAENELSIDTLAIYKSKHTVILLNKYPYNSGHLLVVPKRHTGDYLGLSNEELLDLHGNVQRGIKALKDVYQPHGFNLGANLEKAAGAGLPDHLHFHIVPRYKGDLNFFPLIAETKVIPEAMDQCYAKLADYFRKLT